MKRREALKLSAAFLGYTLSGSVFSAMLQGCQVATEDSWIPQFFTKEQAKTIAEVSDHILPSTDTIGAKDVYVERFIDTIIKNCYTQEQKEKFIAGLNDFQKMSDELTGKPFEKCSKKQRDIVLEYYEKQDYQPALAVWGRQVSKGDEPSFYRELKGLSLFGYFSSEQVGEEVLNYDPIPGKFIGCVPLSEIGNAWSL